jgi:Stress responsive A/B Barrel Domain
MFVHHVFFFLKNPTNTDDQAQLMAGLETMRGVDLIKQSHVGIPADTHRGVVERSYSVSWLITFDTPADQDAYQLHPVHHKFVADCAHLWEKVVVYDSVGV